MEDYGCQDSGQEEDGLMGIWIGICTRTTDQENQGASVSE